MHNTQIAVVMVLTGAQQAQKQRSCPESNRGCRKILR
jgi:hypothetical protein